MTTQINKNIYWSQIFAEQLSLFGVEDVCLSPGSRNTPLTYSFAVNKKFNKHISIDERSSGYFALGIAKQSKKPVAVVTTSGTAVAELYPSIIEAYNQRIPLIICTADRPSYLRNTGANQTINQDNIYSNHIRFFYDCGLPEIDKTKIDSFLKKINAGVLECSSKNRGPIHFNFPFVKPFEPDSYTDELNFETTFLKSESFEENFEIEPEIFSTFNTADKIAVIVGPNDFEKSTLDLIGKTFYKKNIPVFADSASGLNFSEIGSSINNHIAFLRIEEITGLGKKDLILLLGEAPVSNSTLEFIEKSDSIKYSVNKFGDLKDPSRTVNKIIKADEKYFLTQFEKNVKPKEDNFLGRLKKINSQCEKLREEQLKNADSAIESKIAGNIVNSLPGKSNLFIGNSTVIRDFDLFAGKTDKNINIYTNRGTSGIEGNIATALGIAEKSREKTFLVLGDLSFYYDSNSLLLAKQNGIPLTIIIINNNGGGIFSMLPISSQTEIFDKYFNTPHNLNFKLLAEHYSANYFALNNPGEISLLISEKINFNQLNILEIRTDSKASSKFRKQYIQSIREVLID